MIQTRTTRLTLRPSVIRRNVPQRLAGAGYAAITGGWLVALANHASSGSVVGEVVLALMALTGLGLAFLRDDLIIEDASIQTISGLPGLLRRTRYNLAQFDRVVVEEEGGGENYEEGAIRPIRRAWFSVFLTDAQNVHSLRVLSFDTDETTTARAKGLTKANAQAKQIATQIGLPLA